MKKSCLISLILCFGLLLATLLGCVGPKTTTGSGDSATTTTVSSNGSDTTTTAQTTASTTVTTTTTTGEDPGGDEDDYTPLADGSWNGKIATRFNGGDGTEANPYLIDNACQFMYFYDETLLKQDLLSSHLKLTGDIVINASDASTYAETAPAYVLGTIGGEPSDSKAFKGVFDGDGHTISGMCIKGTNVALFGFVGGTVKNLGLVNSYIEGTGYVGGIAVRAQGGPATLDNLYVDAIINKTTDSINPVGGIVAMVNVEDTTISNCIYEGALTSETPNASSNVPGTGGIVGKNNSKNNLKITNCLNLGSVYSGTNTAAIFGNASGVPTGNEITNCMNLNPNIVTFREGKTGADIYGSSSAKAQGILVKDFVCVTGYSAEYVTRDEVTAEIARTDLSWDITETTIDSILDGSITAEGEPLEGWYFESGFIPTPTSTWKISAAPFIAV